MPTRDLTRLSHILDSANAILTFLKGRTRLDFDNDRLFYSAVMRELEIIGEAATKISETTKSLHPEVPWKEMIGLRNRLIHAYFDVNHDIIWKTINVDIPLVHKYINHIFTQL